MYISPYYLTLKYTVRASNDKNICSFASIINHLFQIQGNRGMRAKKEKAVGLVIPLRKRLFLECQRFYPRDWILLKRTCTFVSSLNSILPIFFPSHLLEFYLHCFNFFNVSKPYSLQIIFRICFLYLWSRIIIDIFSLLFHNSG